MAHIVSWLDPTARRLAGDVARSAARLLVRESYCKISLLHVATRQQIHLSVNKRKRDLRIFFLRAKSRASIHSETAGRQPRHKFSGEVTEGNLEQRSAREFTSRLIQLTSNEMTKDLLSSLISCQRPAMLDLSIAIVFKAATSTEQSDSRMACCVTEPPN